MQQDSSLAIKSSVLVREWIFVLLGVVAIAIVFLPQNAATVAFWAWMFMFFAFATQVNMILSGRRNKKFISNGKSFENIVFTHRLYARILTGFILAGVVGVEIAVRKVGGEWSLLTLIPHLALSITAGVILSFLLFRFTGLKDKERHWKFAYTFFACYSIAFFSGTYLLLEKFPLKELFAS